MVFPTTRLPVKVELQLAGVWTDVTGYVRVQDRIKSTRGRRNEGNFAEPGECGLVLNNQDGRFSPRNPTGPYFGLIGRNTPARVSILAGGRRGVAATTGDRFTTPDSAGLSITGDLDLRIDMRLADWTVSGRFLSKTAASNVSYILDSTTDGKLTLFWSTNGTATLSATSTVPLPQTTGRQTVRATLDADNGAAGRTITFYTGPSVDGPWKQLGAPVVQAGTTSIFDGTASVSTADNVAPLEIYAIKILQGIGGTERANPDFTIQTEGATSFVDAAGNTWTRSGAATVTARRYRFHGEISTWPQTWGVSERAVATPVSIDGILRRLGQGNPALDSPLRRAIPTEAGLIAYWPMEDVEGATGYSSAVAAAPAMVIAGAPENASSDAIPGSLPLPNVNSAVSTGYVPSATPGTIEARCVIAVPSGGDTNLGTFMRLFTTGTVVSWDFYYATVNGGTLTFAGLDVNGNLLVGPITTHTNANGRIYQASILLQTSGPNVAYTFTTVGSSSADTSSAQVSGTYNTASVGKATAVVVNADPSAVLVNTIVGHVHVLSNAAANPYAFENYVRGWSGEAAGRRVQRLCSEMGVAFVGYGDLDDSVAMGVQTPSALFDLLAECERADLGQLFESREQLGLAYRTRSSRAAQVPALALPYGSLGELQPIEDDQNTRNDVTVTRVNGGSARATIDTGPMSTQAPPNGVGRYDSQVELNLASDAQLASQANLRVAVGTIDEPRYPVIHVELGRANIGGVPATLDAALAVDCGDLLTISNPPIWVPPGDIEQHCIGYSETLGVRAYPIDFVCEPAAVIGDAGIYTNGVSRWAANSSTLTGSITSTATGAAALSITTAAGKPLWTSDPADFPMNVVIGGEEITLSAIANTASPQSATVSARSVNGVVKAHTAGEVVQVSDVFYYAL